MLSSISTPVRGGFISADRAKFGMAPPAQGPKFKFLLPNSFVPRPIEYLCPSVIDVGPAVWEPRVVKMLTPNSDTARTDGQTDGQLTGFISDLGRDD